MPTSSNYAIYNDLLWVQSIHLVIPVPHTPSYEYNHQCPVPDERNLYCDMIQHEIWVVSGRFDRTKIRFYLNHNAVKMENHIRGSKRGRDVFVFSRVVCCSAGWQERAAGRLP